MKKYIILLLIVLILVLSSYIYKLYRLNIYRNFPSNELQTIKNIEAPLFLFLFFSIHNCESCLEIIEVLNRLPKYFIVIGIVPENELLKEEELREKTGVQFKLISLKKYLKFLPLYAPTLCGVSKNKKLLFVLPGVPYGKNYLKKFLFEFYEKAYPLLI